MENKMIAFDISSKLAHFRKINTNSSSLSYLVPPRTTILGIIAAILGKERDSYYSDQDFMNLNISVSAVNDHKTITQGMNYLAISSAADVSGKSNHTQVPVEYVKSDLNVKYRIMLNGEDNIISEIKDKLQNEEYIYPISLGPAYCIADIDYLGEFNFKKEDKEEFVQISSVIRRNSILDIKFSDNLYRERMPFTFKENRICIMDDYIFSKSNSCISVMIKAHQYYSYNINDKKVFFTFM